MTHQGTTNLSRRVRVLGAFLASLLVILPALAQMPEAKTAPTQKQMASKSAEPVAAKTAPQLNSADLESFLDGFVPLQIGRADIAGVVIGVVKDGKLLFAKGYGYSDVEKKIPVSPENTLFRPGSIGKLFTWTAVMQQVELGKLDLDRDVNDYLDFKIPPAWGKPITLRDIMTHRPGFEETIKELFVGSEKELHPIGQYLPTHMPARIYPPGTTPAYSNYGATLAGYLVERVSGQSFDDYLDTHIFKPLGMEHATSRQPLPERLKPLMSKGYQLASSDAKDFEYVEAAPAGALSMSAEAISRFMIAHLQNGRYADVQILKPETAIQMHQRQQGWPASMNAMCLGFYEESRNGKRIIGHGGDTQWFHSDLHLLLDSNIGFFVSYNSAGKDDISPRGVLLDKFMERYFPSPDENEPTLSTAKQDASKVAGLYKVSRRFETNLLSVTTLLGEGKVAMDAKDNTISIDDAFKNLNGKAKHFREIAPMVFRAVDGHEKIAFQNDANGRTVLYIDYPFMVFQPVEGTDNKTFNYVVLCISLGVMALTLLLWPVAAILRKHYGKPLTLSPQVRRLRMLVRVVCLAVVVYLIGIALVLNALEKLALGASGDVKIHLLQILGVLIGIGTLIAIYNCVKSWTDPEQWSWYKIWNTLLAFSCLGFFWFMYHWHLLNFNLTY